MTTQQQVKWSIEADYYTACSCDYGCPCEFEAPPTKGFCEALGAYKINRGNFGDVSLDGLGFGFSLRSPEALHLGRVTMAAFVDERATEEQRQAILQIASGQAGGMPFEIIASLVTTMRDPQFVAFEFNVKGKNGAVKMGDNAVMAFEPIKNPVTGEPEGIRIEHETGFIFKGADVVAAKECRSALGSELDFSWPDKSGFIAKVEYGN
ncbi:MAG: DUF1326 domain-containing protein [Dehalococcoidia bacterium]